MNLILIFFIILNLYKYCYCLKYLHDNINIELFNEISEFPENYIEYESFSISPDLPNNLKINKTTGEIFGISESVLSITTFLIKANKINSTEESCFIKILAVDYPKLCTCGFSLLLLMEYEYVSYKCYCNTPISSYYIILFRWKTQSILPTGLVLIEDQGIIVGTISDNIDNEYNVTINASNFIGNISFSLNFLKSSIIIL